MSRKRKFAVTVPMTSSKIRALRILHDWLLENPEVAPKNLHKVVGLLATSAETCRKSVNVIGLSQTGRG